MKGGRGLFGGLVGLILGAAIGVTTLGPLFVARQDFTTATALPQPDVETTASVPATPMPGRGLYPAEVLRVADGDSFQARIQVWPGIAITTMVRLRGVDTPELKARCPEERVKAQAARDKLTAILSEGPVEISRVGLDKFGGRIDAAASTRSTPDVSDALVQAGLGRRYSGGRRKGWCP